MRLANDEKGEHRPMRRTARSAKLWRRLCRLMGLSISARRGAGQGYARSRLTLAVNLSFQCLRATRQDVYGCSTIGNLTPPCSATPNMIPVLL